MITIFRRNDLPNIFPSTSENPKPFSDNNDLQLKNQAVFQPQGPLLESQSSEAMTTVDQGNLRVLPTRLSHNEYIDSSVDTTHENSFYFCKSRTTVTPERQQAQCPSTDFPKSCDCRPSLPPCDYHEKVIQNKI